MEHQSSQVFETFFGRNSIVFRKMHCEKLVLFNIENEFDLRFYTMKCSLIEKSVLNVVM